jgi:hypothetical protein
MELRTRAEDFLQVRPIPPPKPPVLWPDKLGRSCPSAAPDFFSAPSFAARLFTFVQGTYANGVLATLQN